MTLKDSGCLGVLVLVCLWVVLFFLTFFTEEWWLMAGASLSVPAIPLGWFLGSLLGGAGSRGRS